MKRPTAIAACLLASAASLPASTASYRVLLAGNSAGVQTTEVRADGERRVSFRYNDRGRGPELTARIRLDPPGSSDPNATAGRRVVTVVKDGVVYDPAVIATALGIRPVPLSAR
jgi:hypothetical protein